MKQFQTQHLQQALSDFGPSIAPGKSIERLGTKYSSWIANKTPVSEHDLDQPIAFSLESLISDQKPAYTDLLPLFRYLHPAATIPLPSRMLITSQMRSIIAKTWNGWN